MALTKVSGDILDTGIVVAGVTTSTNFKTGTSNLHSSGIEIAGINVLGADTPIGAGVTIYNSGGADFTGVVTATRFVGQADISGGSITATTGTFSGDVSIGGTLTYQDVTNVDSTGIATARVGLDILSGGLNIVGLTTGLHVSGVSTFIGAINGNVTGNISGGTVAGSTGTFSGDVSIADKIVHTGDTNTAIRFPANDTFSVETAGTPRLKITSGGFLEHYAEASFVKSGANYIRIGSSNAGGATLTLDGDSNGDGAGTDYCMIKHDTDGHLKIYGDNPANAANIEFYSNSTSETLRITSGGNLKLPDNAKIELGGAQTGAGDLQIYHSAGSDSTIHHTATSGSTLRLRSRGFTFKNQANSQTIATLNEGDACKLFFNGGEKIATTGSGISVTGKVVASGEIESAQDYPNFRPRVDWNFAAVKKLDPRIKYRRQYNASYTDEFGIIRQVAENEPRFDHDPITGECKGLLLEDGRSNLVASSEDMNESFGSWVNNGIGGRYTDTTGVISPDGTTGSTKLIENGATSSHLIYDNVSCSASTGYITSVFLKKPATNGRTFALITEGNTQPATAYFNLVTGTATGSGTGYVSSGTIEYPNGWWRCWMRFNTGSSQSALNVQFGPAGDSGTGTFSYAGDSNKYILAWGAQCESGEMVTSYIKTERHANDNGSTRGQDFTTVEGSDFSDIFDTDFKQFSMVADYDNTTTPDGNAYSIIDLWGEETNYEDRIEWFKDDASPYNIETRSFGGNSSIFANGNLSASSKAKAQRIASSWYVPDYSNTTSRRFVVSMGGEAVDVVSDGSGTSVPSLTRLGIGCNPTRLDFAAGVLHFKRLMFYNRTLSDIQLQNLSAQ